MKPLSVASNPVEVLTFQDSIRNCLNFVHNCDACFQTLHTERSACNFVRSGLCHQSMKMFLWCHGKQSSDQNIAQCNNLPKLVVKEVVRNVSQPYFRQRTCHATSVTINNHRSHSKDCFMFNARQTHRSQDLSLGFWAGQLVTTQC